MSITLKDLPPACGHNQGGIHYLRVIPVRNVVSIPEPVEHKIPLPLVLRDQALYADIWFTSGSFTEAMNEDNNGEFFRPQIQIYVPKDSPDLAFAVAQLTGVRCVCLYVDGNNQAKLVGSLDAPLAFSSDLDTGNDYADKNGYKLKFSTETSHKAYFYLMYEGATPPLRKVFSNGFSFGFLRSQL